MSRAAVEPRLRRVALVVHPTRDVTSALTTLRRWTDEQELELVQLAGDAPQPEVAANGTVGACDLVVALGGDGTVLAALRAAAGTQTPVLGVACGSLGALSSVGARGLESALERVKAGDWRSRSLPALAVRSDAGEDWAVNDWVAVRHRAGQLAADVSVDDELYVRLSGDGLIVATPLGSTAYSMAAGGPVLPTDTPAFLCTPLAMHGGSAPPLVLPADATLTVRLKPGYAGFDVEVDGRRRARDAREYRFGLEPERLRLVTFDRSDHRFSALRRRGLIADSPRILARDLRERG